MRFVLVAVSVVIATGCASSVSPVVEASEPEAIELGSEPEVSPTSAPGSTMVGSDPCLVVEALVDLDPLRLLGAGVDQADRQAAAERLDEVLMAASVERPELVPVAVAYSDLASALDADEDTLAAAVINRARPEVVDALEALQQEC